MSVLFSNYAMGTLSAQATSGATSISSARFASLPVIASPDIAWLTLDPPGLFGAPEIVLVTAHTSSSTSITVTRAQQGTSARQHEAGTAWAMQPTDRHFDGVKWIGTSAPSNPVAWQTLWMDTTTAKQRLKIYNGSAWKIIEGDMPHFELRVATTWTTDGTNAQCPSWDTEDVDTDGFHTSTNKEAVIPTGLGGKYMFSYGVICQSEAASYQRSAWVDVNVAATAFPTSSTGRRFAHNSCPGDASAGAVALTGAAIIDVAAGDNVRVKTYTGSGTKTWGQAASREDLCHFSGVMISHDP